MAQEGLQGRPPATHFSCSCDGRNFRLLDVDRQPLHDGQNRLGLLRGDYMLRLVIRDLELAASHFSETEPDDNSGKQLHAIYRVSSRILDRLDRWHRIWCAVDDYRCAHKSGNTSSMDLRDSSPGGVLGSSNEATNGQ